MIHGLICRVFHKKEVSVEDVVDCVIGVTGVLTCAVLAPVYTAYCALCTQPVSATQELLCMIAIFVSIITYALILGSFYDKHKKEIIAVCPNVQNKEEKKE